MELVLKQKMTLMLTSEMKQSIAILQYNNEELVAYIQELALENPTMEVETPHDEQESNLLDRLSWLEKQDENTRGYSGGVFNDADKPTRFDIPSYCGETLEECLHLQLARLNLADQEQRVAARIIACLDENGYLTETVEGMAASLHVPIDLVNKVLCIIQHLEPYGIGARDLCECLLIQLEILGEKDSLAYTIVQDYLDDLSKNRIKKIAELLTIDIDAVVEARIRIRLLDPRPGANLSVYMPTYVLPDVLIVRDGTDFIPYVNDTRVPTVRMNSYYRRLLKNTADQQVREYLGKKFKQARWVVQCIEQRNQTILQATKALVDHQRGFFEKGPDYMIPMTLSDIAQQIGRHPSTVSRAFRGKYMECSWGVFPFSLFLEQGLYDRALNVVSPQSIKAKIRNLIENENAKKPISDNDIALRLKREGVSISRRTVAKYRNELGILSSIHRKEY